MKEASSTVDTIRSRIRAAEKELQALKDQLAEIEAQDKAEDPPTEPSQHEHPTGQENGTPSKWPLNQEEYARYGRQMIVPSIGIQGQSSNPAS
jgi:adenylyltransferase/sulfurtransferase